MSATVAVVDHGMGNLRSVAKALEAAGAWVEVTNDRAAIARADAVCVPGQGIFGRCVANLDTLGLRDVIASRIEAGEPYLGICLGMQILFESSVEGGTTPGFGLFEGTVERLPGDVRVPHIGWNTAGSDYFYFDHSFAVSGVDEDIVKERTDHGISFVSWIEKGHLRAVQFHPEKSSHAGLRLLGDWIVSL